MTLKVISAVINLCESNIVEMWYLVARVWLSDFKFRRRNKNEGLIEGHGWSVIHVYCMQVHLSPQR